MKNNRTLLLNIIIIILISGILILANYLKGPNNNELYYTICLLAVSVYTGISWNYKNGIEIVSFKTLYYSMLIMMIDYLMVFQIDFYSYWHLSLFYLPNFILLSIPIFSEKRFFLKSPLTFENETKNKEVIEHINNEIFASLMHFQNTIILNKNFKRNFSNLSKKELLNVISFNYLTCIYSNFINTLGMSRKCRFVYKDSEHVIYEYLKLYENTLIELIEKSEFNNIKEYSSYVDSQWLKIVNSNIKTFDLQFFESVIILPLSKLNVLQTDNIKYYTTISSKEINNQNIVSRQLLSFIINMQKLVSELENSIPSE